MVNQIATDINSYLSFRLGEEYYAANVGKVLEIMELTKITKVPQVPGFMRGVINLRGQVLPVIDTRIKFGLAPAGATRNTCIVVVEMNLEDEQINVGILVDAVEEVLEIDDTEIMPPPSIGNKFRSEFILGMARNEEDFLMILDVDKILSFDEKQVIKEHLN
ncbi:MAG: chemotaxis protein CheW [Cyclobacteriaceae bacterium]